LTEIVKNYLFLTLKSIKGILGFILEIMKKINSWSQVRNLNKKCKNHDISTIILPLGMAWVSKEAV